MRQPRGNRPVPSRFARRLSRTGPLDRGCWRCNSVSPIVTVLRAYVVTSVRISDSEAHGTDGGWLMEVTLDHIGPTLDRTSAPLPTLPLCQLCPFAATKTSQTEVRVAHATDFQQNRAWGLLWKHSQLLSRGSDTLAVLPALRSGSRRPRSSPATPSATPCGARGSNAHRESWGSRGPAPLQSRNFQNLTEQSGEIVSLSRGSRGFAPRKMGDTGGVFPL